jgi:hypothetical protein
VREDLLEAKDEDDDAQEDFEVDDEDIELEGDDAEEWTGFSGSPAEDDDNVDESAAVEIKATKPEALQQEQPVASTSAPYKQASALLSTDVYEAPFDGKQLIRKSSYSHFCHHPFSIC